MKVESLLARPSQYSIVTHSYRGGLGHKFISVVSSLLVGLSTKRQWTGREKSVSSLSFIVHLPLPFWEATSTCMTKRQYLGTYYQDNNNMKYPSHTKIIKKARKGKVNKYIGDRNVALRDHRPNWSQYSRKIIRRDLESVGALKQIDMGKFKK